MFRFHGARTGGLRDGQGAGPSAMPQTAGVVRPAPPLLSLRRRTVRSCNSGGCGLGGGGRFLGREDRALEEGLCPPPPHTLVTGPHPSHPTPGRSGTLDPAPRAHHRCRTVPPRHASRPQMGHLDGLTGGPCLASGVRPPLVVPHPRSTFRQNNPRPPPGGLRMAVHRRTRRPPPPPPGSDTEALCQPPRRPDPPLEPPPPPDQNGHYGKQRNLPLGNLVGPFSVHKHLGPMPPPPSSGGGGRGGKGLYISVYSCIYMSSHLLTP